MKKIVIIGGGASGLVAAIFAKNKDNMVTILEKRDACGKKILVTGNGKCNYWNENQENSHYNTRNMEVFERINSSVNKDEVMKFFTRLGIVPYIKNGYYYPYSKEASTIRNCLLEEVKRLGIEIKNNFKVDTIYKKENKFIINNELAVDKVILATGSFAYYDDKDSNIGYNIAKSFGHSIIKTLPSLVQLTAKGDFLNEWKGIRSEAVVSLYSNNKIKEEKGEIQLTDYGISGICIFNLSSIATRLLDENKKVVVNINFAPWYQENDFLSYLEERSKNMIDMNMESFLKGFLNSKLVTVMLKKVNIPKDNCWNNLNRSQKESIADIIRNFTLEITGTKSFKEAQVCSGGIRLSEINPDTMESNKEKGLYIIGELLDVDGECGGYNLSFAFMSGMLAGKSVNND